ncbi:SLAP domain-containing protein [Oceanobacillus manasiensis]|uniref:SLAP domain-containing protein n=1 Tax=Oceanobacillus manasiensis TaxID=586413 RepID=UPI0005A70054|nr:SLAP domain-containing protein [Oceanobacillus manasiensis]
MQRLVWEQAWDKTISLGDRKQIEITFEQANEEATPIKYIPFWQARNYRGELLITVIVQNFSDEAMSFTHLPLKYVEEGELVASHTFSYSNLELEARSSMPWTFIFPEEAIKREPQLIEGMLQDIEA